MNGVAHVLGLDNASGAWYLWWSGFGGRVVLGGGLVAAYLRRHNCHEPGCWRFGKHPHNQFTYCRKHHPDIPDKARA